MNDIIEEDEFQERPAQAPPPPPVQKRAPKKNLAAKKWFKEPAIGGGIFVLVLDELRALGIAFSSVTEPMDTTTPSGTLLLHIVGAFAQFERETIRERTRAGLARARRAGKRLGRPRVPLDLDRVRVLHGEGKTLDAIAAELGVTRDAVFRALHADIPARST